MLIYMPAKDFWRLLSKYGEVGTEEDIQDIDYRMIVIRDLNDDWVEVEAEDEFGNSNTIYYYPDMMPTTSQDWCDEHGRVYSHMREGLVLPVGLARLIAKEYLKKRK